MRSVDDHQAIVDSLIPPPRTERITVASSLGRVLATDVYARISLPSFDNSAMDGYAVRAADVAGASTQRPVRLPVAQDIPAGRTDQLTLSPGTAHRIMTGAPIPAGADAIVMVESTDGGAQEVTILADVLAGISIRHVGSDIREGEVAARRCSPITSSVLGLLYALGIGEVDVFTRPRVVVLSTGSELVAPGQELKHGQIYESNGPMLVAAITEAGAVASSIHFVPDDVAEFRTRLDSVIEGTDVDLILTSGGVSAGAYEVVKDALAGERVEFVAVAMQPGGPQGAGRYRSCSGREVPIVCVPGNPVSAQVSFELFLRAPLRQRMGLPARRRLRARLTEDLRSPAGKRQFRRGLVSIDESGASVDLIGPPSSHHLRYLAMANALVDIAAGIEFCAADETMDVILLDESLTPR